MKADEGIGSWIRRRAAAAPTDIALTYGSKRWTYAEKDERVRRVARLLAGRGVGPGDRIAYHGPNHPVALESLFAAASLGAVWVPILPGRSERDVAHILRDSGAGLVISSEPVSDVNVLAMEEFDGAADTAGEPPEVDVALDDLAILGYTSGTTGLPKGAMLTHGNLTWNVLNVMSACAFGAGDRTLALAPFTRLGGLGVLVLETLFVGGTVVIPDGSRGLLETISEERITHLFANPAPLAELVADEGWERADLSDLKTGVVGGTMVPEPLLHAFLDRGVPLRHGYGLTEAAPVVTLLDERDAVRKFGSVGKPVGLVDVAIDTAPGETGEILVRGPNVIRGYWNVPSDPDPEGWWRTGDAGHLDEDGYLFVAGRLNERIEVAGRSLYPSEVEQRLHKLEGVEDAAVIGDGARLAVFVVAARSMDADRLRASVAGSVRDVTFELFRVGEIPRNAAGKILRNGLQALLTEVGPGSREQVGDLLGVDGLHTLDEEP